MEEIEGVKISQLPKASAVSAGDLIPGVINGETQAIDVNLLKGQKGDQGDAGPAGPQGKPGPQGEPGTGGELYDEFGQNTDGALTQKFVSDILNAQNPAIGFRATAGSSSTALGDSAKASNYGTAIGRLAIASGLGSVAMGDGAHAMAKGAVALGVESTATIEGEVNIGAKAGYGYQGSNSRVLAGLHDGVEDDHATTVAQLNTTKTELETKIANDLMEYYNKTESDNKFVDKTAIVQSTGESTTAIMSQKAITDMIGGVEARLVSLNSGEGVQNDNQ